MGSLRRNSDANIKLQSIWPVEERDTMVTCPVCGGTKVKAIDGLFPSEYILIPCKWCNGLGSVTKKINEIFNRWTRIYSYNKLHGRCKK
jgi:hypothetical protein